MTIDELVALGVVAVAAAWLIRYFVRRIRSVAGGRSAPPPKLVQITFQRKDDRDS
jgi:hypothetical protein